jgi:hypothetical protein
MLYETTIPERHLRYSSETPILYQNDLDMRISSDVTGVKPIIVRSQSILGVSAGNPVVPFTTSMEERERIYSFFCYGHHTRQYSMLICINNSLFKLWAS